MRGYTTGTFDLAKVGTLEATALGTLQLDDVTIQNGQVNVQTVVNGIL